MVVSQLTKKIRDHSAVIGIIGMGYVGLPLMLRFSEIGFRVLGIDIDKSKVEMLNAGESYIQHIDALAIGKAKHKGFSATTDFTRSSEADALIICVPTPLDQHREPDLSFVIDT